VYVDLPANSVKAGMFAKGEFALGKTNTLSLPQQALVLRDGFSYVFTLNNNRVRQTKVQTGKRIGNLVEIVSGITANQAIVATGGAFLSDNDLVKVVTVKPTKKLLELK
jgi:HlyD family secretion protein